MKAIKREVIKEKFTELYLEHISDVDIEFLYNYIIKKNKPKTRYHCATNNAENFQRL